MNRLSIYMSLALRAPRADYFPRLPRHVLPAARRQASITDAAANGQRNTAFDGV